jgi:hypothetical protein
MAWGLKAGEEPDISHHISALPKRQALCLHVIYCFDLSPPAVAFLDLQNRAAKVFLLVAAGLVQLSERKQRTIERLVASLII